MPACLIGSSRSLQPSFIRVAFSWSYSTVIPCTFRTAASASPCQYSSRFHIVMNVDTSPSPWDGVTSMSRR